MSNPSSSSIIALDVGDKRIGVALASHQARIASPLVTLTNDETFIAALSKIIEENEVGGIVVGLPRGMDGQETNQTKSVREFAKKLHGAINLPLYWQDEAVTSINAEAELRRRGKAYTKGDIDALAATVILEDYLHEHQT